MIEGLRGKLVHETTVMDQQSVLKGLRAVGRLQPGSADQSHLKYSQTYELHLVAQWMASTLKLLAVIIDFCFFKNQPVKPSECFLSTVKDASDEGDPYCSSPPQLWSTPTVLNNGRW